MPRPHTLFTAFMLASIPLFWVPLYRLASLSLDDRRYSHIVLIPVIAAFVIFQERRKIFSQITFRPRTGLPFLGLALAIYALLALRVVPVPADYILTTTVLAIVLSWLAGFVVCYGVPATRAALFPLLLLLLLRSE